MAKSTRSRSPRRGRGLTGRVRIAAPRSAASGRPWSLARGSPTPRDDRLASRARCQRQPDRPPLRGRPDRPSTAGSAGSIASGSRPSRTARRLPIGDAGRPGRSPSSMRSARSARPIRAGARTSSGCSFGGKVRPVGLDDRTHPRPASPLGRAARADRSPSDERPPAALAAALCGAQARRLDRSSGRVIWSSSTPSTSDRVPGRSGSSSPPATWSRRWDTIELGRQATAQAPPRCSITWPSGCRSRFGRSASTTARSSWPTSRPPARPARIALFVLPPRSPKLHGAVERANRTHTEEFYQVTDVEPELEAFQAGLRAWEVTYNTIRPHKALGYLTRPNIWPLSGSMCNGRTERLHLFDRIDLGP